MPMSLGNAFIKNFLSKAPDWYKLAIISFLIINPIVFYFVDPFIAGWMLIIEFIFTLAMALKCYPLQPGGLLAIQAVAIGMTSPNQVYHEIEANLPVLLLLYPSGLKMLGSATFSLRRKELVFRQDTDLKI
jgi:NhaB family Na+:H+ antiporter